MKESGYYPPGAEFDARAPWNQVDTKEKTFDTVASQTLTKKQKILTSDYSHIEEKDLANKIYEVYDDTSEVNWVEEFHDNDHYTPLQLIEILKDYLTRDAIYGDSKYSKEQLDHLIEECEGWEEEDFQVEED